MSDSTLKELWQQVAEKKSCEAKQKELTAQRDTLADRLKKLEKSKLAEQADVDRLEGHSLAAFFYQVIGKMDEKLDKERQEAYAIYSLEKSFSGTSSIRFYDTHKQVHVSRHYFQFLKEKLSEMR